MVGGEVALDAELHCHEHVTVSIGDGFGDPLGVGLEHFCRKQLQGRTARVICWPFRVNNEPSAAEKSAPGDCCRQIREGMVATVKIIEN